MLVYQCERFNSNTIKRISIESVRWTYMQLHQKNLVLSLFVHFKHYVLRSYDLQINFSQMAHCKGGHMRLKKLHVLLISQFPMK
jgi:hypothetical protein